MTRAPRARTPRSARTAHGRNRSSSKPSRAADVEPTLERLIVLAIFPRCPNKEVAEDDDRDHEDEDNDYLSGELHRVSVLQGSVSVALPPLTLMTEGSRFESTGARLGVTLNRHHAGAAWWRLDSSRVPGEISRQTRRAGQSREPASYPSGGPRRGNGVEWTIGHGALLRSSTTVEWPCTRRETRRPLASQLRTLFSLA